VTFEIIVSANPTEAEREAILAPLRDYNSGKVGPSGYEQVGILIRDSKSQDVIGGLWGKISFHWLFVELLYLPPQLRGQDIGTQLLIDVEKIARQKNCVGIWLDSFSFQAPKFYMKNGYEVFGTLDDHPRGSQRFFLRKRLDTPS
jgi:GNAT superfamily N-acetyltransferase